ncbi:hypothetical protein R80B4_01570 [Fibrobacteres bacterium R8-0-B4]
MQKFEDEYPNVSIFVSSTFRDMHAERDKLRYAVLPQINEFAEKYGSTVEIIDLRWGVDTASDSEENNDFKVLRTCFKEINRSRPFFLGLIGDRYGKTPPRKDIEEALTEVLDKSDVVKFLDENPYLSVTALEIEYGVLRWLYPKEPLACLFYFRESPADSDIKDQAVRIKFLETYRDYDTDKTEREAQAELDAKKKKLEELKIRIHDVLGEDVIRGYKAKFDENWKLVVQDGWVDDVVKDIKEKLLAPKVWGPITPNASPDWRALERKAQRAFRESRTKYFAGRDDAINKLVEFCLGDETTPPLRMIHGEAGSGKSGLLCMVMDKIEDKCLLLPFSCGISSNSRLVEDMLRYFIFLLYEKLNLPDERVNMEKFQDIKFRFMELLDEANKRKLRVVAVVDALDQLFKCDEAQQMLWISGKLPENFRLLCSIIDGPEIKVIQEKHLGKVELIEPIEENDRLKIIHNIASRQRNDIKSKDVENRILQNQTAAQNPLYLSLIIRNFTMMNSADFAKVDEYKKRFDDEQKDGDNYHNALTQFRLERIDETLKRIEKSGDSYPEGAYLAILDRLEELCAEHINPNFDVRKACTLIAVSRNGLRESDLMGALKNLGTNFNSADFSWLRYILPDHISLGDKQQWDFVHQSMRRALMKKMPPNKQKLLHYGIVRYFREMSVLDEFAAREIMYHLYALDRPYIAAKIMAAHDYLNDDYARATTLARGLADVYTLYKEMGGPSFLMRVPQKAKNVEATKRRIITEIIRIVLPLLSEDKDTLGFRLNLMHAALETIKNLEDQETLYVRVLGDSTIANLYMEKGDLNSTDAFYKNATGTITQISKITNAMRYHISWFYQDIGYHMASNAHYRSAFTFWQNPYLTDNTMKTSEEEELSMVVCNNMWIHLMMLGKPEDAYEYYQKAIEATGICKRSDKTSTLLAISYSNMGDRMAALGETGEASKYYKDAYDAMEQIYKRTYTIEAHRNWAVSCDNIGDHLMSLNKTDEEAGKYYKYAYDARDRIVKQIETTSSYSDLLVSCANMGNYFMMLDKNQEANDYCQRAIDIIDKIDPSASDLCDFVYRFVGDCLEALANGSVAVDGQKAYKHDANYYHRKAIACREKIYIKTGIAAFSAKSVPYTYKGHRLITLGKKEKDDTYYLKILEIMKHIHEQNHTLETHRDLSRANNVMGIHLTGLGKMEEACEYYRNNIDEKEHIHKETGDPSALSELSMAYGLMWIHLTKLGKKEEAKTYFEKAYNAEKKIFEQPEAQSAFKIDSIDHRNNLWNHLYTLSKPDYQKCQIKISKAMVQIYEQNNWFEENVDIVNQYNNIERCLRELNQTAEADIYKQKASKSVEANNANIIEREKEMEMEMEPHFNESGEYYSDLIYDVNADVT